MADRITEKGIERACVILASEGYLDTVNLDPNQIMSGVFAIKEACKKYMDASKAKGSARTFEEKTNALLIAFFVDFLEDYTSRVN